jgi:hypothetical protein
METNKPVRVGWRLLGQGPLIVCSRRRGALSGRIGREGDCVKRRGVVAALREQFKPHATALRRNVKGKRDDRKRNPQAEDLNPPRGKPRGMP